MNKKLIRLTEQDLHRIVKESVDKILNEIGNTPEYQNKLGRLAALKKSNGQDQEANDIGFYAQRNDTTRNIPGPSDEYTRGYMGLKYKK